ncbi:cytochrome ubiquinol oxidase subunit I [Intrasporangium calvum]|uniref:Cytochrome bd quinol oxidase subunit 1 apoprotein n=1 Tax=Intrasporangium calvum (strain ATCC 23552 / DSM 43043 / JCM 3097 / NBRC 12989 / NCIMB 10167 / NRRL B-3866 / 7 KIP) TaxID=710696 RepID=E6S638_INTC7|nr:cytochrome ubiquinol oxidase subunit I [Intrasporangium calvum]ADU46778.1 cytochrome bd quinol oxidase subunit 1 apoprotein [Intrasporangium calvum DSM 43043]
MDATDLARWQFAITTVYHFLFVPITIGLSAVVAYFHTRWVRTHRPEWLRLAKFYGKLFTINFALGLVTGIVQEFQFGMNWSDYSRFVGDIFGAPLAVEALLAFFLESTFLGLWIFGWGRIPERLHAATMWIVHIGTLLSAYFILAANSFMQNPVGYRYNPDTGRAELTDFFALLTNKVQLVTFPHVILAAYMVGGAVVMGVALHLMRREALPAEGVDPADRLASGDASLYRTAVRIGAVVTLVAGLGVAVTGDIQGKIMTEVQPMKMAAAEGLYESVPEGQGAPFSVLTLGTLDGQHANPIIEVPGLLSFLATGDVNGAVAGILDLKNEYAKTYGETGNPLVADPATDYVPNIPTTYWTFRLMIGVGMAAAAIALAVLWLTRKGRTPTQRWLFWAAVAAPLLPVLGNSFGWIFTEVGRQPWLVFGLMTTASGVSPSVSAGEVIASMVGFTLLYGALAVVEIKLFLHYVRRGADPFEQPQQPSERDEDAPLVFAY